MIKHKMTSSLIIDYSRDVPARKMVGAIIVSSRNRFGIVLETSHASEASAARERVQRARAGHTEIFDDTKLQQQRT